MEYKFKCVDKRNGELIIDSSGSKEGFFFAGIAFPVSARLKLRIIKDDYVSTFDLKNDGSFEMFPLQAGNGNYQIILYKNISGTKYAPVGNIILNVVLKSKYIEFLVPNQYVNYHQVPEIVAMTKKMCYGKTKKESYYIIRNFIKNTFLYDYVKATQVKKGALPDMKTLLKKKQGICFDIATLAVSMFRIAGIPAKLTIGMADNRYHAWVEILNGNDKIIRYDPTFDIYGINKINKYTPERFY